MKRRQFLGSVSTVIGAVALTGTPQLAQGVKSLGATAASPDPALQGVSPDNFYVSLVKAIDQAEGRVRFYLYKGCWTTSVSGTTVRWKIESANQKAIVRFKYAGGVLNSAEIKFQPAIKVGVPTVTSNGVMLWNTIERIAYGDGGEVVEPPVLSGSYEVEQHFRMAATPDQLFQGQPFANASAFTPEVGPDCPAPQEPTFSTLVREVELLPDPANNLQAFKAVFKPNSTIRFSADNLITLADSGSFTPVIPIIPAAETPNSIVFQNLNFKTKTRALRANLRQFNLVLASASFNARNFSLNLAGNSSLIFANVDITRGEDGRAQVDSSDGRLTATVGDASKIKFAEAANETNFTLNDRSRIDLRGFVLSINDQDSTKVTVGPESIITVGFHSGTIGFGRKGSLSVDEGGVSFVAKALCTWGGGPSGSPAPLSLQGEFAALDAKIISGTIPLTDTNVVELRPGTIVKATKLELNTALQPALAGSFDTVVVKGAPNGNLSLLRGFDIRVKDSGVTITATDPLARLTIERNRPYPTGRYVTECSYETLDFTAGPILRMVNGYLKVDITNASDGSAGGLVFRGNSIHFDGDMIEGDVSLGDLGGLRLAGRTDPLGRKNIILDVKGEWALNQTQRPRITGKLTHIGVDITSGNLKLNELSRLDISGGRFVADGLDVDTDSTRPITGRVRSMALDVREDSTFGLRNGFSLVSKARKDAFLAEDTAAPLTLPPGAGMPYGAFRVGLDYKKAANGNLVLTDGFFDFPLVVAADGSISGRNIKLSGDSKIAGPGVTVPILVALERGTLQYTPAQLPTIEGDLTVSTKSAFDLTVTSPGMDSNTNPEWRDDHEDRVIWPITIKPRINPFSLPTTTVTFKGSRLTFKTGEFHIPVTANIPEGLGEHDPSTLGGNANGQNGPDWAKNAQEFFTETFAAHRLHAYLKPGSVRFNPLIRIEHTDDTLIVSVKSMNLLDDLPVDTDGIEGVAAAVVAVLGFLLGTLITGNPVAGAIAGVIASQVAQDKIAQAKAMALLRIADRISNFSRDFPFKIPTP